MVGGIVVGVGGGGGEKHASDCNEVKITNLIHKRNIFYIFEPKKINTKNIFSFHSTNQLPSCSIFWSLLNPLT